MKTKIIALLATDEEFGIGKDNKLAWHCPQDLKVFKEKTQGSVIIMGRKTLESLPEGKPLPNRINVVLTRKVPKDSIEGVVYVHSVEEALEFCKDKEKAYVIGGVEIYEAFQDHYTEIHETNIKGNYGCDTTVEFSEIPFYDWDFEEVYPPEFSEKGCIATSITVHTKI